MATLRFQEPTEIFIKNPVDGYKIPASVFKPTDAKKDAPITVFYHGGGWVAGSTQTHFYPLSFLSNKTKTIWISIDYRLAPKYKYKTQLTDYKAALEWVINNREQLSSKDAKIGVCGDSAGGHIAALMAHCYKSILSYQILIYPVVDLRGNYNEEFKDPCYFLTPQGMTYVIKEYLDEPEMAISPEVSPILIKDFSNLPKALIIEAEFSILIDSIKAYHQKILEANGDSQLNVIKNDVHGFFTGVVGSDENIAECFNLIADFISKF